MNIDKEIDSLKQMTLKMAEIVLDNLQSAMSIFYNYDEEKANQINDDLVDLNERLIEEMCLNLILKERCFAKDLRIASGILKLVEDLERLGDHAEDIKEFAYRLKDMKHHQIDDLDEMYKESTKMVFDAVNSFMTLDIKLASSVIKSDDKVDTLYNLTIDDIIYQCENKQYDIKFAIYTTLVVKYIERIADHAVNIAEWVIYIKNGYHKDKQIF